MIERFLKRVCDKVYGLSLVLVLKSKKRKLFIIFHAMRL